jgi:Ca2+-binding RTX toxin-like protein
MMRNLIRIATSAVAVGAALAVVVGTAAGQASSKFKQPKIVHGVLTIKGTKASDTIALRLQDGQPSILQVDVGNDGSADFSFSRDRIAKIVVAARSGDDLVLIDESKGAFTDQIPTTIGGGGGNDTIAGGKGNETLLGGGGNDSIDGNGGNDLALLGPGDDTFVWDPGDGSDTLDGQAGADTMLFNGAGGAEQVDLSANGNRLRFFRTQAAVTMDTAGIEQVVFNALGGADLVTVNDLTRTDVSIVDVDLAGTPGSATGDGQPDRVVVNATDGEDSINVQGDASEVKASGLAPTVAIFHSQAANDRLEVNTLAGRDSVESGELGAGAIQLLVDGVLVP